MCGEEEDWNGGMMVGVQRRSEDVGGMRLLDVCCDWG